jgi:hypothetical protein
MRLKHVLPELAQRMSEELIGFDIKVQLTLLDYLDILYYIAVIYHLSYEEFMDAEIQTVDAIKAFLREEMTRAELKKRLKEISDRYRKKTGRSDIELLL